MTKRDGLNNLEHITIINFYNTRSKTIAYQHIYKEKISFKMGSKLTVKEGNSDSDEYRVEDKKSILKIRTGDNKINLGIKDLYDKDVSEEANKHILCTTYTLMNVDAD